MLEAIAVRWAYMRLSSGHSEHVGTYVYRTVPPCFGVNFEDLVRTCVLEVEGVWHFADPRIPLVDAPTRPFSGHYLHAHALRLNAIYIKGEREEDVCKYFVASGSGKWCRVWWKRCVQPETPGLDDWKDFQCGHFPLLSLGSSSTL